jgi:hypothetical protein
MLCVATVKLLWFFVWRMALLGLALGAGLGLVYGATLLLASLLVPCALHLAICIEATVNQVGAGLILPLFGAGFGLLLGATAGFALGLVGGLVLSLLTRLFYYPPADETSYRNAAGTICGVTVLLLLCAAWANTGFDPTTFVVPVFTPSFYARAWLDLVFITLTPMLGATAAMWWAGRKVGGWYADGFREP